MSLQRSEGGFLIRSEDGRALSASRVILAMGGKAGLRYGSAGEGYKMAKSLGLSVSKPVPALTMLICAEDMAPLFGVRTAGNVSLYQRNGVSEKRTASSRGEIQFAREGISGICCMDVSRYYRIEEGLRYALSLDFFPECAPAQLGELLFARRARFSQRSAGALWRGLLPEKLGAYLLRRGGLEDGAKRCALLSAADLARQASLAKDLRFEVVGSGGWNEAQVTSGGVSLSSVSPDTLEALAVPGLYCAGELLDLDGPCGGYNLTAAFATGVVAGAHAAKALP